MSITMNQASILTPRWIAFLSRVVGVVFLVAGIDKMVRPEETFSVAAYFQVAPGVQPWLVLALSLLETWTGLWLLIAPANRMGRWVGLALLTVFIWYLIYLARLAHPPSCGCGGLLAVFNSNRSNAQFGLVRNMVMAVILMLGEPTVRAWVLDLSRRQTRRSAAPTLPTNP